MKGDHGTGALLELAEHAESLGFDSLWVGDSLTARPRHEPMTLLSAVAARTTTVAIGTAVLIPALRNPVILAHQVATLDRIAEGRLILGVGIGADLQNSRLEFEFAGVPFDGRVGRMNESFRLCKALWTGEPVDWDGRWTLKGATVEPTPHRLGGPPIWYGGQTSHGRERTGKLYEGWFPNRPTPEEYKAQLEEVRSCALAAGRDPGDITAAIYLTLALDVDKFRAEQVLDSYLEQYYDMPAAVMRERMRCFGGSAEDAMAWIKQYVDAGATHVMLRFAGDHQRHLEIGSQIKRDLGW